MNKYVFKTFLSNWIVRLSEFDVLKMDWQRKRAGPVHVSQITVQRPEVEG